MGRELELEGHRDGRRSGHPNWLMMPTRRRSTSVPQGHVVAADSESTNPVFDSRNRNVILIMYAALENLSKTFLACTSWYELVQSNKFYSGFLMCADNCRAFLTHERPTTVEKPKMIDLFEGWESGIWFGS